MLGKYKKLLIFGVIILAVLLLNWHYGWSKNLTDQNSLAHLKVLVSQHFFKAALLYIVLTVVGCVVLALPGVTFAIFAGILFGPWWGIVFCLVATTLGAAAAFLVGRFLLKDAVKPMVEKNKTLKHLLFDNVDKSDLILLLVTRILPLFPYNLQNFAYGITDVKFWRYTLYSFVFMLPGVTFITVGAAGLSGGAKQNIYFILAGIMAVSVLILGLVLKHKYLPNKATGKKILEKIGCEENPLGDRQSCERV